MGAIIARAKLKRVKMLTLRTTRGGNEKPQWKPVWHEQQYGE